MHHYFGDLTGIPECDIDEVVDAFIQETDRLQCVDNFRWCLANKFLEQSPSYKEAIEQGCCGSREVMVNTASGNRYWIGFNYGH